MTIGPFSARGRTASYVSNLFRKETFIDDHNHFEGDDNGKMDSNQKKIFYASCIYNAESVLDSRDNYTNLHSENSSLIVTYLNSVCDFSN